VCTEEGRLIWLEMTLRPARALEKSCRALIAQHGLSWSIRTTGPLRLDLGTSDWCWHRRRSDSHALHQARQGSRRDRRNLVGSVGVNEETGPGGQATPHSDWVTTERQLPQQHTPLAPAMAAKLAPPSDRSRPDLGGDLASMRRRAATSTRACWQVRHNGDRICRC